MTIAFKSIPAGLRLPGFYAEIDASRANTAASAQRALIIGQITAAGTYAPGVPVLVASTSDARTKAGVGSYLAAMIAAYRANDPFGELWVLPIADDPSHTSNAGILAFTGTTTAVGTISLYIAGQLVPVVVGAGTGFAAAAAAVVAAVNAAVDLPVTATLDGSAESRVVLLPRHKGALSGEIDIRVNHAGSAAGQALPAGLTLTITPILPGAGVPSIAAGLAALGTMPFDFIVSPYTDAASIAAITALLSDATGRWSWQSEIYGHCFIARRGTQGTLASFGAGLNDQHLTCIGFSDSPTPAYVWAAALAGAVAPSVRADPAVPLQTLPIAGVLAPPPQSRFIPAQRNMLLYSGISTFRVDAAGAIAIENLVTTYQVNGAGQADNSYLEAETMFTLMAVLRAFAAMFASRFARVKLGGDGVRYPAGSNVVTPSTIRAELVALYRTLEDAGLVQASDAFAATVTVNRVPGNPGRVDVLLPVTLIGQLRTIAAQLQFKLS